MSQAPQALLPTELQARLDRLRCTLRVAGPSCIAVSGGVDSRFLARVAWTGGLDAVAVLFVGPHISPADHAYALEWLRRSGHPFHVVPVDPFTSREVSANTRERCYYCKRLLFAQLAAVAAARRCAFDGSNASDACSFRPGRRALAEFGIRSPLAEAGLFKPDIRLLARAIGLDWPDQPSRPCLLTRIAYGLPPSRELLARIGAAEDALAALGLIEYRLRVTGQDSVRLQLTNAEKPRWDSAAAQARAVLETYGLGQAELCWSEELSGFFDREPEKSG